MGSQKIVGAGPTRDVLTTGLLSQAYGREIDVQWTPNANGRLVAMCTST